MRLTFGVWRLVFGVRRDRHRVWKNSCSDNDPNNYYAKIAMPRRYHEPLDAERQTPSAAR